LISTPPLPAALVCELTPNCLSCVVQTGEVFSYVYYELKPVAGQRQRDKGSEESLRKPTDRNRAQPLFGGSEDEIRKDVIESDSRPF
jgi:hypothetical protein